MRQCRLPRDVAQARDEPPGAQRICQSLRTRRGSLLHHHGPQQCKQQGPQTVACRHANGISAALCTQAIPAPGDSCKNHESSPLGRADNPGHSSTLKPPKARVKPVHCRGPGLSPRQRPPPAMGAWTAWNGSKAPTAADGCRSAKENAAASANSHHTAPRRQHQTGRSVSDALPAQALLRRMPGKPQ